MAVMTTYDAFLNRISGGFWRTTPFDQVTKGNMNNTTSPNSSFNALNKSLGTYTIPTLEAGVTSYIPTKVFIGSNTGCWLVARQTLLGTLVLGTNTFTDGSAMPTVTEMNSSQQRAGLCIAEVSVARDGNAASFTITYVDQDGNAGETGAACSVATSATVGQVCFAPLNTPDWGVRDLTSAARSSGTGTGTLKFWGLEPIGMFASPSGKGESEDFLMQCLNLFPLGVGDVIGFYEMTTTSSQGGCSGYLYFVGDS